VKSNPTHGERLGNVSLLIDRKLEAGYAAKLACIASDTTLTYEALSRQVNRMGHLLRELGVRREQRVLLALDDTADFPIAFLGAMRIGAVPVPVSPRDTAENFRYFIEDSYAEVLVCGAAHLSGLHDALKGHDVRYLARGEVGGQAVELGRALAEQDDELTAPATHPDDVAFWLYSSGSTGKPKGVVHLHRNVQAICEAFGRQVLDIGETDRIFSTSKLHHAYALGNSLLFSLYFGASTVLVDGPPQLERLLDTLREQRPTVLFSVPALYALMAGDPHSDGAFDSVRLCVSASAALPVETFDLWLERFGLEILDGIGSTEMLSTYCSNRPGEVIRGTTGRPVPGYRLRLTDEAGIVLEGAAVGELEVSGESCAAYYWHQREKAMGSMRGEWFSSGDRYERREDGAYVYVGRTDDMLKVGGLWVSPIDIERVLLEHPAVADVGVVGVTIDNHTRIAAVVECVEGVGADDRLAHALREWCKQRMRDYEHPQVVRFVEEMPRTLSGKPRRFKLRELVEAQMQPPPIDAGRPRRLRDALRDVLRGGKTTERSESVHARSGQRGASSEQREAGSKRRDGRSQGNESTPESIEVPRERADTPMSRHMAEAPAHERTRVSIQLVCEQAAIVLGDASARAIVPQDTFKELGFDSVTAVTLRNRLNSLTGLELSSTLIFDHPTPTSVALELRRLLEGVGQGSQVVPRMQPHTEEPIAIVGMGCRYPGGVRSPEELWRLVAAGGDAISEFPTERGWQLDRLYDPDPDALGTSYVRTGGFLHDAAEFDAGFFGIRPREAMTTDPQQRLLLETAWEALEDAGIDPASLRGTDTGVFTGVMYQDYGLALSLGSPSPEAEGYALLGSSGSVASGRISYVLGLEGPAVSVDTACSSSLVALHLACQSLRLGECSLALAGGVTVMATPGTFVEYSRQRALSPDGRCKAFAHAADGTGFSEGVGVVLLERLSEARRRGHRVLAVVRGSAVNQDGASNGLTAPNGPSQQRVIAQALANAGLSAGEVDVVEGHGTGTALGDPIEAQALLAVYGHDRPGDRPLWLGSVKSNIGHTQAAAGVAGLIKMVKALEHGLLPRTLHVDEPSREVDWSSGAVSLLTEELSWRAGGEPRRAGVSSFGVSGTNAHVILEDAPVEPVGVSDSFAFGRSDLALGDDERVVGSGEVDRGAVVGVCEGGVVPWVFSARGGVSLRGQAERLLERVGGSVELGLADVGVSLAGRSVFEQRAVVLADGREGLLDGVGALARGESAAGVLCGAARVDGGLVFLFPGQGSQWVGMAVELLESSPVFAGCMRDCLEALEPHIDWSPEGVLRGDRGEPALERVDVVQPLLFAVMVSLAGLWRACGVCPDVVVGHSQGEIAAAHVVGGLSLEDAARVVALRSRALVGLAGKGGMLSVALGARDVALRVGRWGDRVAVAAVNGPSSVVLSGELRALEELLGECVADGVRARMIPVDYAAHSSQVEAIREELLEGCAGIEPRSGDIPFYSAVTGGLLDTAELDGEYWYRNLRETVQFERATRTVLGQGQRMFVEVSPHPVLSLGVGETVDEVLGGQDDVLMVSSLRRGQGGLDRFLTALGEAWVGGVQVDWSQVFAGSGGQRVPLPTYAFQRQRFWLDAGTGVGDVTSVGLSSVGHPFLGAAIGLADGDSWLFTGRVSLKDEPWLADHAVLGTVVFPGTAFLDLALHVGGEVGCGIVRELTLETPLVLSEDGAARLQVTVGSPDEDGNRVVGVFSCLEGLPIGLESSDGWTRHASGVLASGVMDTGGLDDDGGWAEVWPPEDTVVVDVDLVYERLTDAGLDFGPSFRGLRNAWRRGDDVFTDVSLTEDQVHRAAEFGVHPALLDAALHPAGLVDGVERQDDSGLRLGFSWSDVRPGVVGASSLRVCISSATVGSDTGVRLIARDNTGRLIIAVGSLLTRPVDAEHLSSVRNGHRESLFNVHWTPIAAGTAVENAAEHVGEWAVMGVEDSTTVASLRSTGASVAVYRDLAELDQALDNGVSSPKLVVMDIHHGVPEDMLDGAKKAVYCMLDLAQRWIADERYSESRLVVLTKNALAARAGEEVAGLTGAGVWGLVRTAQAENPNRFALVDIDTQKASFGVLRAVVNSVENPQLAVRDGELLAPRLARVPTPQPAGLASHDSSPLGLNAESTVLVTGEVNGLGGLVARHLVAEHDVASVMLCSPLGIGESGAAAFQEELQGLGARMLVVACDVSDREAVTRLLEQVPGEYPLGGVIHAANAVDDGLIGSLTRERVEHVWGPKVDGAWHLHELTEHLDLSMFVTFSAAAATIGVPGQGSLTAANFFLDSLVAQRRAQGLVGASIAWGPWGRVGDTSVCPSETDLSGVERSGMEVLAPERVLQLFDAVCVLGQALTLPVQLNMALLRAHARMRALPAILSGVVSVPDLSRIRKQDGMLARRLASKFGPEREQVVFELVRDEVAAVLGHVSSEAIDSECAFKDLGFDSLATIELRNRLNSLTGLLLPVSLAFDYPTTTALSHHLLGRLAGVRSSRTSVAETIAGYEESVAIIGMSCRYPAGVRSPRDLWNLVANGIDAIGRFPTDRGWDLGELFDPDPENVGTSHAREGGFLYDVGAFDAGFFGISPREALAMDPQQRILLEASWEAFENAGLEIASLRGSQTAIFAGINSSDYGTGLSNSVLGNLVGDRLAGAANSVVSGRVAYVFGLEGPALTLDTACSSSLVALHLACQALRSGECSLALAGGVTVMATPELFVRFSRHLGLARDGRCKSFADDADGAGFSEGVGVLLLERLSDARRNGHRVMAVVRGSAVNQDGASNGLTAPNGPSQERVIRQALANAGLVPGDVDVVEAHGTGTTLGDPIEAQALLATYGQNREEERPLWLGSIKSNLGHTQAAAGVAGLIKMVMALQQEVLPKTLHVKEPARHVDWSAGGVSLLTDSIPWERGERPRRAGVSSFGVSGTNAHVLLEEAPVAQEETVSDVARVRSAAGDGVIPWVLSGRGASGLCNQAGRLAVFLDGADGVGVGDVGLSLARRSVFEDRAVVIGSDLTELSVGVELVESGRSGRGVVRGVARVDGGRAVFVFPGQGSQWVGMAVGLLDESAVFAKHLRECGEALGRYVRWSVEDVLRGSDGSPGLDRVEVVQPVLFAVMVSLAGLWRECGVEPAAVVGHSQGEIAAACVTGGLSLDDAARVVALRSRALAGLAGKGGMASVALRMNDVLSRLGRWEGRIGVAAENGPFSVVVSGDVVALGEFVDECVEDGVRARAIPVDYAAHSWQVEQVREELLGGCAEIQPRSGDIPFYSALTGGLLDTAGLDGAYWYRNLREPVSFGQATRTLFEDGYRTFLEMSPHPVLTVGIQETVEDLADDGNADSGGVGVAVAGSLRRDEGGLKRFLTSLGEAWVQGVSVEWQRVFVGSGCEFVDLPTYAFERERYWLNARTGTAEVKGAGVGAVEHPLLNGMVGLAGGEGWLFTGRVSLEDDPWLADHLVRGTVLLPGTAVLEMVSHAGRELGCSVVGELTLEVPLVLPAEHAIQLQVRIGECDEEGARAVNVFSHADAYDGPDGGPEDEQAWTRHANGLLTADTATPAVDLGAIEDLRGAWPPQDAVPVEAGAVYESLAEIGLDYGPAFKGLQSAWRRGDVLFAEVSLSEDHSAQFQGFGVHPALFDAALHASVLINGVDGDIGGPNVLLPFSWGEVRLGALGASALRVRLWMTDTEDGGGGALRMVAVDEMGRPVVSVGSLLTRAVSAEQLSIARGGHRESLFSIQWVPVESETESYVQAVSELIVLGRDGEGIVPGLKGIASSVVVYSDLGDLDEDKNEDKETPHTVLLDVASFIDRDRGDCLSTGIVGGAHDVVSGVLGVLQAWIKAEWLSESRLVVLTTDAVAARSGDRVAGLVDAGVWGLLRSAQAEHPGRFGLIDLDGRDSSFAALPEAIASNESQLAVRDGELFAARLVRCRSDEGLRAPEDGQQWRLETRGGGTFEDLALVSSNEAQRSLSDGEVRVEVCAAGLNFRDVLVGLGVSLGDASMGGEGAGIVLEVGPGVERVAVGDRVMGLLTCGFAPVAVTDHRCLVRIPDGWSFVRAASVPIVFLTAYHGLVDLAGLRGGERVLVHSAAGGVGMAAVQIARHMRAEVYGTASPGKWRELRSIGLDEGHIASSRTLEYHDQFLAHTEGRGMDVVLNSLAREFVDASFGLLPCGGRFLEMGKTDIRSPDVVAAEHPGVAYQAFDLMEVGRERVQEMLGELLVLFEAGALEPLPVISWDMRRAPEAFRFMSQARHTGKIVLTLPFPKGPEGTVLITGGSGGLGALIARHLVTEHRVQSLVLTSRRGVEAPGALELQKELEQLGARVLIEVCDVSDRDAVEGLLGRMTPEFSLRGVVHAAGILDDGVIESLTAARVARVLEPKIDAAWHLHELTKHLDLSMFVLFSSASATLGSPGQGNYAAANCFLDALAAHRRARGLPGTSIAWGYWEQASEMTGGLGKTDFARMARQGLLPLSVEEGLDLFDAVQDADRAHSVPIRLDIAAVRAQARTGTLPGLLRSLVRVPARRLADAGSLVDRLAEVPEAERESVIVELVRSEVANVLGHVSASAIHPDRAFKDLGFDSLAAVELRNRLNVLTGGRLPATLAFDYPNTTILGRHLLDRAEGVQRRRSPGQARVGVAVDELVAIVGMSCRYPGGAHSPQGLWELVANGADVITGFPTDRGWDLEGLFDPDPSHPGTSYAREGGFLPDAGDFDAEFFGISPREALAMDPQQRLFLEISWEAFEDAGFDPTVLRGSRTGVFTGISSIDYASDLLVVPEDLEGYLGTGVRGSVVSGRVAYAFGLEGPAVTVDTACSSSLVALHWACQALRSDECSLALAGGVTVSSSPRLYVEFSRQRGIAPDGRCKSFANAADGAGFSEGVGAILLERLSDARRNGHRVLAVMRGSALNQDGASNGLTAPNGPSQERVILQALANSGVSSADVDLVEAHGTGTTLGDPIEAQALLATYGQNRAKGRPLWLGSIKSNIGHTQAAAGMAGVIKVVKAFEHEVLPRTLHVDEPSREIDWSTGDVSLLSEQGSWKRSERPRRAGVSSFGISGTNAHVILEEAPFAQAGLGGDRSAGLVKTVIGGGVMGGSSVTPWVLSGRGVDALAGQADRLVESLGSDGVGKDGSGIGVADVGLSLASRAVFGDRAIVVGDCWDDLLGGMASVGRGEPAGGVARGLAGGSGRVVFVFPGQGSQWVGMAVRLLDESPVFRERLDECGEALSRLVGWSVEGVLRGLGGEPALDRVDVVQPVLFAVMVALAGLWRACGVEPAAVVGHSQGEIAAAHVAGGLSLDDAAQVVVTRSHVLAGLSGKGGMASVALSVTEVVERVARWDGVGIAAVNGPSSVVVSGDVGALRGFVEGCVDDGVRARVIPVDYAAHSSHVEGVRDELLEGCERIEPRSGKIPFCSAVTGGLLDTAGLDGDYWYANLREPVAFDQATQTLLEEGYTAFVETSPHPVLTVGLEETIEQTRDIGNGGGGSRRVSSSNSRSEIVVGGSLRRGEGGLGRFLISLGEIWVCGVDVNWKLVFEGSGARRVSLPTYAFQRERYWLDAGSGAGGIRNVGLGGMGHPFLGAAVGLASGQGWLFTGRISLQDDPWLADHAVLGTVLLPGTAFLDLALHAGCQIGCSTIRELTLEVPLVLPENAGVLLQVSIDEPDQDGQRIIRIYSRTEDFAESLGNELDPQTWTQHATGTLTSDRADTRRQDQLDNLKGTWPPQDAVPIETGHVYERLADTGLDYGPVFQCLKKVWQRGGEIFAEVSLLGDDVGRSTGFSAHPVLLDAALHPAALVDGSADALVGQEQNSHSVRLPFSWNDVCLGVTGASSLRVCLTTIEDGDGLGLLAVDEGGDLVVSAGSMLTRPISPEQLSAMRGARHESLFNVHWAPVFTGLAVDRRTNVAGQWALLGREDSGVALGFMSIGTSVVVHRDLVALGEALDGGSPSPQIVFVDACVLCADDGDTTLVCASPDAHAAESDLSKEDLPGRAQSIVCEVLAILQEWLASERFSNTRLVVLTNRAVLAPSSGGLRGLSEAGVWGLLRSAQAENPGRIVLMDIDEQDISLGVVQAALDSGEPQLAVYQGDLFAPRLARETVPSAQESCEDEDRRDGMGSECTVLVTGGTSGLGALFARWLVAVNDVRSLVLASRRGIDAPGAGELQEELELLGARVQIVACDVSNRDALKEMLETVPEDFPLRGVAHAAGVLDDGVIGSLTGEHVARVFAPKVEAAWYLHELTEHLDLSMFTLFSSGAGVVGSPGQGNYAAASSFLDALADHRRALGLVGTSIAWGHWEQTTELTKGLSETDLARMTRSGVLPLSTEEGMELFAAVAASRYSVAVAIRLDIAGLRALAREGRAPSLFRDLVRAPRRRSEEGARASLGERLAAVPEGERENIVSELVRSEVARVLGHVSPLGIDPGRTFKELGFDSLAAVELRNGLNDVVGLYLPATLIFDYPRPEALVEHLLELVVRNEATRGTPVHPELDRLEAIVSSMRAEDPSRRVIMERLRALLSGDGEARQATDQIAVAQQIDTASDEEIFAFLDGDPESL
jgi:benzoate-CoA ligase family protein